jgi:phage baseplate assembly protein V
MLKLASIDKLRIVDQNKINGVIVGILTDNVDPEGLGRVKANFALNNKIQQSGWIRIAVPMAGGDRGTYFLPDVGDEVLLCFQNGDISYPFVIGALWNSRDKPPAANTGQNDRRLIKSRSGHQIILDDTKGNEKIQIIDATGKNSIIIDSAASSITIKSQGDLKIKAQTLTLEAGSSMSIKASGALTIQGCPVKTN